MIPTPSGRRFTQDVAHEYAEDDWLVFACGRYEGIDSRVAEHYADRTRVDEVSVGDYVLAGGEAAVLVMVEATARLLPGVLGNPVSVVDDSFAPGEMAALLEGPVFTKPPVWRDLAVPEILLSGDHGRIAAWRREQARERTARSTPGPAGLTLAEARFRLRPPAVADWPGSRRSPCHRGEAAEPPRGAASTTRQHLIPRPTCGECEEIT